jgi:hypothetical protein
MLGVSGGRKVEARARALLVCNRLDTPTLRSLAQYVRPAFPVDNAAAVWRIPRGWNCRGTVLRGTESDPVRGGEPNLSACATQHVRHSVMSDQPPGRFMVQ